MILKNLYNSLLNALNESKISQRTIDRKLWLTVASICSRNRSTESEFIKPLSKMTKDDLLHRYVAALLIMKKKCPETENDIEQIKTFKLFGQKYLSLGGTINEIKKLFIENGGSGTAVTTSINNVNIEKQKLDTEIKTPAEQQIKQTETPKQEEVLNDEDIDELPNGINSYDLIFKYVNKKYTDLQEIYNQIYAILETTFFTICKTFYKINIDKNNIIYFNSVTIDVNKKQYIKNTQEILISWVKLNNKQVRIKENGILSVIVNNMNVNNQKINQTIKLSEDTYISLNDFTEMSKIILSKLLYIKQKEYNNPFEKEKNKKVTFSMFGSFNEDKININKPINNRELNKIENAILKKFNTIRKIINIFSTLLVDYKIGNENGGVRFRVPTYYDCLNAGSAGSWDNSQKLFIYGVTYERNYLNLITTFLDKNSLKNDNYLIPLPEWRYSLDENYWQTTIQNFNNIYPYTNSKLIYNTLVKTLALLLYYSNNYDLLIK